MRFGSIAGLFSAATSHVVMPHSSMGSSAPDSSASVGKLYRSGSFGRGGQKSLLRLSSSLQDFSAYYRSDPEQDGPGRGVDQDYVPAKPVLRENGSSSFSKEKGSPRPSMWARRKWVRIGLWAFGILLLFSLIYLCSIYLSGYWSRAPNYYVILDCGSTGTRVYVYEWSVVQSKGNGGLPIKLRPLPKGMKMKSSRKNGRAYQRMETEPGFDKLVRNESGLRTAMMPLLRWAEKQIPKRAHKTTSIFLYATAGVRRLPASDSDWLLNKAWSILKESPFICHKDWVKIISGMEEAYFGWIALNHHMDVLGSYPAKETFGSLDLGGSSLQVTFENEDVVNDETNLKLSIGSVNHHLSAYSLAGYGLNDAFDKSVVHILKHLPENRVKESKNGRIVLKHPCLQTGYKEQYVCSQCAAVLIQEGSPVTGGKISGKGRSGIPIDLLGAPQWEECRTLAKTTVNLSEWSDRNSGIDCDIQPCALDDKFPRPHGQFYAMSGFFVVFKFFNLTSEATIDDMLQKGQDFCEKPWNVAKNSVVPQPFIEQYCFRAPYVSSLLRDGLHIRDSDVIIGSGSITWTLGVALLRAGQQLSSRKNFPRYIVFPKTINRVTIVIILALSVILFFALTFASKLLRKFYWRASYLPLFRRNSATNGSVLNMASPFSFQGWTPIIPGDSRVKMPLSPTVAGSEQHPFGMGHSMGSSSTQFMESSPHPSVSVSHSYSSGSLGQVHNDSGTSSFWPPHRGQMQLQSRRSQSREDLNSSIAGYSLGES